MYEEDVRPVENKDQIVNVFLQLIPKFMEFGSRSSTFTLHYWLKMKWTDNHLKWNPGEFQDVKRLHVLSNELWMPDFMIINTLDHFKLPSTTCVVQNTGNITCVWAIKTSVSCASDYTYWPYDKQTCKFISASSTYQNHEVDFYFIDSGISMDDYALNHEWLMTRQEAERLVFTSSIYNYTEVTFEFDLKRHSRMAHSVFVTPAAILMLFTMTVLWLDSKSIERIILAGVNFVCHLFCIYDLHWMVPLNGLSIPHILVFYRDSLVLAAFALIMTIVFRKLQMINTAAPNWIFFIVSILKDYRLARFLVTSDQELKDSCGSETEIEDSVESIQTVTVETNKEKTWSCFSTFMEWMSLFSIFITYLILLATLIPK
ncbi:neuronal acetylcholine receptor subunit alpha-5-like isoform X2 [Belonocnema kinseyi]|nr:neuronal acetylcholine receptor subunit alpha-5-like isoform X2 [Belonocnema kinseyi]